VAVEAIQGDGMTAEADIAASLAAFGFSPRPATAAQTSAQRTARALAGLGVCWALALGGLFIPVAHLVLVPLFVTAGIVVAVRRAREDRRLLLVRGACPRCGEAQEFRPGGRFVNGRSFSCPGCHGHVTLATDSVPE
jgi:hypothetical protein